MSDYCARNGCWQRAMHNGPCRDIDGMVMGDTDAPPENADSVATKLRASMNTPKGTGAGEVPRYFAPSLHNNEYAARVESGLMNSAPPEVVLASEHLAYRERAEANEIALIRQIEIADRNVDSWIQIATTKQARAESLTAERDALLARAEAAEKDAQRWRHMYENDMTIEYSDHIELLLNPTFGKSLFRSVLDAAIAAKPPVSAKGETR